MVLPMRLGQTVELALRELGQEVLRAEGEADTTVARCVQGHLWNAVVPLVWFILCFLSSFNLLHFLLMNARRNLFSSVCL